MYGINAITQQQDVSAPLPSLPPLLPFFLSLLSFASPSIFSSCPRDTSRTLVLIQFYRVRGWGVVSGPK